MAAPRDGFSMYFLAAVFLLLGLAQSQVEEFPSAQNFLRRSFHSATVLGNNLYIFGGDVSQKSDVFTIDHSNKTLAIPLDEDWNAETVNSKVQTINNQKNFHILRPALWPNPRENGIYSWGGGVTKTSPGRNETLANPRLRVFRKASPDSLYGTWSSDPTPPGDSQIKFTQESSWTSCNGVGFIFGGLTVSQDGSGLPATASPGLVKYDMASHSWKNESQVAKKFGSGPRAGNHARGSAVCLPTLGTQGKGIVVFVGGGQRDNNDIGDIEDLPMDTVYFYDIGSNDLYAQKTTSESSTPLARQAPCAVAAQSSNNRSYEIFVFGGAGERPANTHILTIPGFRWFHAGYPGADTAEPRCNHACVVAGNRQMISVGGTKVIGGKHYEDKDPWGNGIKVFDMVNLKWSNQYNSGAPAYESPAMIKDWYDRGNVADWDSDAVRNLFPAANTPGSPSGPNVGAIAGGAAAGGIVLTALVGGLLFWYHQRRRGRAGGREAGTGEGAGLQDGQAKEGGRWDVDSSATPASANPPSEVYTMPTELHNGVELVHELQPVNPKPSELPANPPNKGYH
ncbi:hypothetical protein RB595_007605 [Gaeumannomyces hyphopodioides]